MRSTPTSIHQRGKQQDAVFLWKRRSSVAPKFWTCSLEKRLSSFSSIQTRTYGSHSVSSVNCNGQKASAYSTCVRQRSSPFSSPRLAQRENFSACCPLAARRGTIK